MNFHPPLPLEKPSNPAAPQKLPQELTVETSGIGLSSSDEAILMETCGNGTAVLSAGKIQEHGIPRVPEETKRY